MTTNHLIPSEGMILESLQVLKPAENPLYKSTDDISSGRLFADVFKEIMRYNVTAKQWYYYDGRIWQKDTGDLIADSLAKSLARALYIYAVDADKPYRDYVERLSKRSARETILKDAKAYNFISREDLDANNSLFNCRNCVINLDTGKQMEHSPDLLLSKISNVVYDKNANSTDFENFLSEVMQRDFEKIDYLQRLFGYALTADVAEEAFYLIYGATTRNGKGTLMGTVMHMMGDYAMNAEPETLAQRKKDTRTASGDIARLADCRLLNVSEPPKKMIFDTALVKALTGRGKQTARYLYESEFEFEPQFKLVIDTNYLPVVNDDTLFSSGRVRVITFDRHFSEEEQDKTLKTRLRSQENISSLFNWCLTGLQKYRENGLHTPEAVRMATQDYRKKSDKMGCFIEDCLESDKKHNVSIKNAYELYSEWCTANGYGCESKRNFTEELKVKNIFAKSGTVGKLTTRNVIKGYRFSADALSEFEAVKYRTVFDESENLVSND